MNLLFVADASISNAGSGTERVLFEQATRMAARSHSVHLMTRWIPEIHGSEHQTISGVTEWRYRADPKHPLGFFADTIKNGGRLFRSLHQDIGFDCIFLHQPLSAMAVLFTGRTGIRKIYTCHSLWHEEYLSRNAAPPGMFGRLAIQVMARVRKRLEKTALDGADRIVTLSAYTGKKLRHSHGVPDEKISVIPGGVDCTRFRPADDKAAIRGRLGLPENRVILFTLRNLEPRMGLSVLLRAMEIVLRRSKDVHLVIGGEGPLKRALVRQAEETGLTPHVLFTGFIQEEDLPDYYRMADLFILPTQDLEGFGLVTLEAMASGTPVLGTPVGGTLEILESFDRDLLFDDISEEAMARLIIEKTGCVRKTPGAYEVLRLKTRAFVEDNYSWEKNIDAMLALAIGRD
ncbi:MAG: glycosyltransferase family 4 protein [Thermodesulfobacteriota bacterium]